MSFPKYRIPRTTVGRFWGYVAIFIALTVSLAGNVTAAYLHDKDPEWVDIGFAGIPPLVAFLSIEIVNHNPWEGTDWGPRVRWFALGVVGPAAAVVSFIHLVTVALHGRFHGLSPDGILVWTTAVLTALLIDGLMLIGTAALLLPKPKAPVPAPVQWQQPETDLAAMNVSVQDTLRELARQSNTPPHLLGLDDPDTQPLNLKVPQTASLPLADPPKTLSARLGRSGRRRQTDGPRERYKPTEHPLWADWTAARARGNTWSPEVVVLQTKTRMSKEISLPAAARQIARWEAALAKQVSTST